MDGNYTPEAAKVGRPRPLWKAFLWSCHFEVRRLTTCAVINKLHIWLSKLSRCCFRYPYISMTCYVYVLWPGRTAYLLLSSWEGTRGAGRLPWLRRGKRQQQQQPEQWKHRTQMSVKLPKRFPGT